VDVLIKDQRLVTELLPMDEAIIGEVLTGKAPGRTSPDEITLSKWLGIAIEDLAPAHNEAEARRIGTWFEIGGRHLGSAEEE
jgi:ornithine cyclodeaminase/alanine dehydrogenase-like protein (mu-crystallin family)